MRTVRVDLEGHPFSFPENLEGCVSSVLTAGEYRIPNMPDLDLDSIKVILDIGANVGAFVRWAHTVYKRARFICFEPHPGAFEFLRKNVGNMPGLETILENKAVTSDITDGKVRLWEGSDWGMNTTFISIRTTDTVLQVHAISPDELPPCDLLKVDAEGVELDVIAGYRYLDDTKVVLLEWHQEHHKRLIENCLIAAGLRCFGMFQPFVSVGRAMWVRSHAKWDWKQGKYVL